MNIRSAVNWETIRRLPARLLQLGPRLKARWRQNPGFVAAAAAGSIGLILALGLAIHGGMSWMNEAPPAELADDSASAPFPDGADTRDEAGPGRNDGDPIGEGVSRAQREPPDEGDSGPMPGRDAAIARNEEPSDDFPASKRDLASGVAVGTPPAADDEDDFEGEKATELKASDERPPAKFAMRDSATGRPHPFRFDDDSTADATAGDSIADEPPPRNPLQDEMEDEHPQASAAVPPRRINLDDEPAAEEPAADDQDSVAMKDRSTKTPPDRQAEARLLDLDPKVADEESAATDESDADASPTGTKADGAKDADHAADEEAGSGSAKVAAGAETIVSQPEKSAPPEAKTGSTGDSRSTTKIMPRGWKNLPEKAQSEDDSEPPAVATRQSQTVETIIYAKSEPESEPARHANPNAGHETRNRSAAPKLSLEIAGPRTAAVGQFCQFEIRVKNSGPSAAEKLTLSVELPPELVHQKAQSLEQTIDNLAPGLTYRALLRVRVKAAGKLSLNADVASAGRIDAKAAAKIEIAGECLGSPGAVIERSPTTSQAAAPKAR